ncbi:hypothetical protein J3Q64DRAFT_1043310 [Phycomyces blakesleeanus]|uniref:Uncharacterized protein n=1 Tax=Phycomyces blakesleeanus TaxID=4837 RepID=A0ABR3BF22_PHYBL
MKIIISATSNYKDSIVKADIAKAFAYTSITNVSINNISMSHTRIKNVSIENTCETEYTIVNISIIRESLIKTPTDDTHFDNSEVSLKNMGTAQDNKILEKHVMYKLCDDKNGTKSIHNSFSSSNKTDLLLKNIHSNSCAPHHKEHTNSEYQSTKAKKLVFANRSTRIVTSKEVWNSGNTGNSEIEVECTHLNIQEQGSHPHLHHYNTQAQE